MVAKINVTPAQLQATQDTGPGFTLLYAYFDNIKTIVGGDIINSSKEDIEKILLFANEFNVSFINKIITEVTRP